MTAEQLLLGVKCGIRATNVLFLKYVKVFK